MLRLGGYTPRAARQQAGELLGRFGLSHRLTHLPADPDFLVAGIQDEIGKGLLKRGKAAQRSLEPTALARRYGATILSYWLAPTRSLVWVVTAGDVSVVTLPPASGLEEEINAYRDEILLGRASLAAPISTLAEA